jgi:hypothetical protein
MQIENGYMNRTELACDAVHWWIMSTFKENLVFVATRNSVSGQTFINCQGTCCGIGSVDKLNLSSWRKYRHI